MEEQNKIFVNWLQNAYAMETALVEVLEAHAKQAEDYPEVESKILDHLEETKSHAQRVKMILENLDEDTAVLKNVSANLSGMVTGASTALSADKLIKNSISDYAAEHMEIATYNALITAAEELGHPEVVKELELILKDEEDMAEWLETNLSKGVKMFLNNQSDE